MCIRRSCVCSIIIDEVSSLHWMLTCAREEKVGGKTSGWRRDSDRDNPGIMSCRELDRSDKSSAAKLRDKVSQLSSRSCQVGTFFVQLVHAFPNRWVSVLVTGPKYVFWSKPPVAIWYNVNWSYWFIVGKLWSQTHIIPGSYFWDSRYSDNADMNHVTRVSLLWDSSLPVSVSIHQVSRRHPRHMKDVVITKTRPGDLNSSDKECGSKCRVNLLSSGDNCLAVPKGNMFGHTWCGPG